MPLRHDDANRVISCAVRDLVEYGLASPHLGVDLARSARARTRQGQHLHAAWQEQRAGEDNEFSAEQTLRHELRVDGWTLRISGRVDGITSEGGTTVVEELKSVALDRAGLWRTSLQDWGEFRAQLAIYLWILHEAGHLEPIGRLVLVSVLDGSRHVLGVKAQPELTLQAVLRTARRWVADRQDRIAWMEARQGWSVRWPFDHERPGQAQILSQVHSSLSGGRPLLIQAPTGLGKTAPVLIGALRRALATGRQVLWATARTTQQAVALQTARALIEAGTPLRVVVITSKERACLNGAVDCRAEVCRFAEDYFEKIATRKAVSKLLDATPVDAPAARRVAEEVVACPYHLATDAARRADVVIADYNYVFDPDIAGSTLFGDEPAQWIVVCDEAHQLVERGRSYGSPSLRLSEIDAAVAALRRAGPAFEGVADLAEEIGRAVISEIRGGGLIPGAPGEAQVEPDRDRWSSVAGRVDAVAADYALLRLQHPDHLEGGDPWTPLGRAALRFSGVLSAAGPETVGLVDGGSLRLLCLDPSAILGSRIAGLGGFVGCSATLRPWSFYRDLIGLPADRLDQLDVPSPFPADRRAVVVAPRVSTRFSEREQHAPRTAALVEQIVSAIPGNVAVYAPSFAVLDDLLDRLDLGGRGLLRQQPAMSDLERQALLDQLTSGGEPVVLGAVLGGIFAEGIDLPGEALRGVIVIGPGLPPVGLERDLLRACFEERYGEGFSYASLIPGMTRVIQAAGRVVRGPEDSGCVVLVGKRFRWRQFACLLPSDWLVEVPQDPAATLRAFFASLSGASAVEEAQERAAP